MKYLLHQLAGHLRSAKRKTSSVNNSITDYSTSSVDYSYTTSSSQPTDSAETFGVSMTVISEALYPAVF
jgi:hypothetical protein